MPSWSEICLNVSTRVHGRELTSSLRFAYGTNDTPQVSLGLRMPPALLLRSDWIENSQSATAQVRLHSDVETNGTIRISVANGADKVEVRGPGLGLHVFDCAEDYELSFPVDGIAVSEAADDVTLLCEYLDAPGEVADSVRQDITFVSPRRISVNHDAVQDVAVLSGTVSPFSVIAEPTRSVIPSTSWNDAKLRADRTYTGWRKWDAQGVDINRSMLGSTMYAYGIALPARNGFSKSKKDTWKCNAFVADMIIAAGLTVPVQHHILHLFSQDGYYPPVANEWANSNVSITGWEYLGSLAWPEPGYVVGHPAALGSGHVGIVDFDGEGIAAGKNHVTRRYERFLDGKSGLNKYIGSEGER